MNENRNKQRMRCIIVDALQIARLKTNGSYKEGDGLVRFSEQREIDNLIAYHYNRIETEAMGLLLSQEIEYEQ